MAKVFKTDEEKIIKAITDYVTTNKSSIEIANEAGVKRAAVYSWLKKAGIKRRRQKKSVVASWSRVATIAKERIRNEGRNAVGTSGEGSD